MQLHVFVVHCTWFYSSAVDIRDGDETLRHHATMSRTVRTRFSWTPGHASAGGDGIFCKRRVEDRVIFIDGLNLDTMLKLQLIGREK
ncbi:predicted protein [Histoplasma mississippiense (nom. inval.)]|uniref:predicted protein n=1 Tax=Ajellomyces capsulatus (strain NAm1 / WU24) TaxID=2059318 RepID=UPI000157C31D|nr:predicted protein [Histoplasma mississippiense (nom. inval.)]EDN07678.1 predicted protein [Histoplasma mississippiense (nom. inval.)]